VNTTKIELDQEKIDANDDKGMLKDGLSRLLSLVIIASDLP